MNHQKSFFFLTDRSFALNQSPACATSIKVGTSVMKVETFIGSEATWRHQGCTAASRELVLISLSSLITCGPLYNRKSRWQVSHESNICGIQKNYLICSPVMLSFSIQLSLYIERTLRYRRTVRHASFLKKTAALRFMIGVGDVGLPGTVRGHFKERSDGDRGISCTFPEIAFSHSRLSHWG